MGLAVEFHMGGSFFGGSEKAILKYVVLVFTSYAYLVVRPLYSYSDSSNDSGDGVGSAGLSSSLS